MYPSGKPRHTTRSSTTPQVCILDAIPGGQPGALLSTPCCYQDVPDLSSPRPAPWTLLFIRVADTEGLRLLFPDMARFDHLYDSIVRCRTQPPCPPECRRHLLPDPSTPHGFNTACQRTHAQKAALSVPTLCGAPAQHPLQWSPADSAYYADGSCITQDIGTNRLGAAFFHVPSHTTCLVEPPEDAEINTITRAELVVVCFTVV